MASHDQFAQVILKLDGFKDNEWKEVSLLSTGAKLGNFVRKRSRNFVIRLVPILEKYWFELKNEKLEQFLVKREGHTFCFGDPDSETKMLPNSIYEEIRRITAGFGENASGNASYESKITTPPRQLKITSINRRKLEEELKLWKLDMKSAYVKEMKNEGCIPCIVNDIVEAIQPGDEADCRATNVIKQKLDGKLSLGNDVLDAMPIAAAKGQVGFERNFEQSSCVSGPVLYKVLPLEVNEDGAIIATRLSEGFTKERVVADGTAGNFSSCNSGPTLQKSFDEIEACLGVIIDETGVAEAFRSLTCDEIRYLYREFGQTEGMCNDVEIQDNMPENCRAILLFAKFEPLKSGSLTLKESFIVDQPKSFSACYYMTVVLSEIPIAIHDLLKQSKVNMFPLLKDILLSKRSSEGIVVSDDVLESPNAKELLASLDINVKERTVVGIPTSLEQLASVVWVAMLYGDTARALQHQ